MARYRADNAAERRTVSLRSWVTPEEKQRVEAEARAAGNGLSEYVRSALPRRGGQTPIVAGTRRNPDAKRLADELRAIGINLNQIAHVANTDGDLRRVGMLEDDHRPVDGRHVPRDRSLMVPRIVIGKGITGAVHYVLGEGKGAGNDNLAPGQESRVAWMGGQNFGFEINSRETGGSCPPHYGVRRA